MNETPYDDNSSRRDGIIITFETLTGKTVQAE